MIAAEVRKRLAGEIPEARVSVLPNLLEICVPEESQRASVQTKAKLWFQSGADVNVVKGCRPVTALAAPGFGGELLKDEYVSGGKIKREALVAGIVNAFPKACKAQVDGSTLQSDAKDASFKAHERRVTPSARFSGIVIKEKISVSIHGAPVAGGSATDWGTVFLSIESKVYWRRASANSWIEVATIEQIDPAMLSMEASSALSRCGVALAKAVTR